MSSPEAGDDAREACWVPVLDALTDMQETLDLLDQYGAARAAPPENLDDHYPPVTAPIKHAEHKVGRNDPCPCGSGKKYKKCCGRSG